MSYADLNELGFLSYNELRRIGFIPDKDKEFLTGENIQELNEKLYEKIGDLLLKQILEYKDGKLQQMSFRFSQQGIYVQLVLMLAMCYINNMNLNNFFELKV